MADADEIDEAGAASAASAAQPAPETDEADAPAGKPQQVFSPALLAQLRLGVPAAWLVAVFGAGFYSGVELAFLVLAGGVLILVITLIWISVQSLTGGASLGFEEALGMGAPSKVEEQKRAVLRALKDLEYERGVGKISPEDYAELSAKYRADAKRLMQTLDETLAPARAEVERVLSRRLSREGLTEPEPQTEAEPKPGADTETETETEPEAEAETKAKEAES